MAVDRLAEITKAKRTGLSDDNNAIPLSEVKR